MEYITVWKKNGLTGRPKSKKHAIPKGEQYCLCGHLHIYDYVGWCFPWNAEGEITSKRCFTKLNEIKDKEFK
jgi:hypothetical protein